MSHDQTNRPHRLPHCWHPDPTDTGVPSLTGAAPRHAHRCCRCGVWAYLTADEAAGSAADTRAADTCAAAHGRHAAAR